GGDLIENKKRRCHTGLNFWERASKQHDMDCLTPTYDRREHMVKVNFHLRRWHVLSLLALVFAVAISAGAALASAPPKHLGNVANAPQSVSAFAFLQPGANPCVGCIPAPANGGTVVQGT